MKKTENKSIVKNSNKAKSVVDFFELEDSIITCYCYRPGNETEENYTPITVRLEDFELWLDKEGYLSGSSDEIKHPDDPCQGITTNWSFSIHEFMNTDNHYWNISDLLTNFLNKK